MNLCKSIKGAHRDATDASEPKAVNVCRALAAYALTAILIIARSPTALSAGVGLRFKLDKKNHINYRVDLGFGREGRTLSIRVGEAF